MRTCDPRAVYCGLEFIWERRKFKVVEYGFTGAGNLVVRARELFVDGSEGDPELLNLGRPEALHLPD